MVSDFSSTARGIKLPAILTLSPPPLEETGAFLFEPAENGSEKAYISLPLHSTLQEINAPLRTTATLEVERRLAGCAHAYAIGKVEKDDISVTRTHFSDVARFIGVPDILPVHDTYKVGLMSGEKARQLLRLANMMALFNALGNDNDELSFIPTVEQTVFHMNYADELQGARDALLQDLAPRYVDPKKQHGNNRQFGVLDGGKLKL